MAAIIGVGREHHVISLCNCQSNNGTIFRVLKRWKLTSFTRPLGGWMCIDFYTSLVAVIGTPIWVVMAPFILAYIQKWRKNQQMARDVNFSPLSLTPSLFGNRKPLRKLAPPSRSFASSIPQLQLPLPSEQHLSCARGGLIEILEESHSLTTQQFFSETEWSHLGKHWFTTLIPVLSKSFLISQAIPHSQKSSHLYSHRVPLWPCRQNYSLSSKGILHVWEFISWNETYKMFTKMKVTITLKYLLWNYTLTSLNNLYLASPYFQPPLWSFLFIMFRFPSNFLWIEAFGDKFHSCHNFWITFFMRNIYADHKSNRYFCYSVQYFNDNNFLFFCSQPKTNHVENGDDPGSNMVNGDSTVRTNGSNGNR